MIRRNEVNPINDGAARVAAMMATASIETLAKRASVSPDSLRRYLAGKTKPSSATRKRLATLGIPALAWDSAPKAERAEASAPEAEPLTGAATASDLSALSSASRALAAAEEYLTLVRASPEGPMEIPRALKSVNDAINTYARIRGEIAPSEASLVKSPQFARFTDALMGFLKPILTPDQFDGLAAMLEKLS